MTKLIQADFNGTQVLFQNDAYLNATTIAKRFNKQPRDYLKSSRTKEYINALIKLQKSIKTKILIEENQLTIVKAGSAQSGGGTWLHPKLAIDFARWLSAEFAVWCDEQIEKILHGSRQFIDRLSTSEDRIGLRQAVSELVSKKGLIYPDAYAFIHQRFGIKHLEDMTREQVNDATQYVHELTLSNVLEGELMPQKEPKDRSQGVALMEKAIKVKILQDERLLKVHSLINEASLLMRESERCSGAIWDGLHESQVSFDITHAERCKAEELVNKRFEDWKAKNFMD